MIHGLFIYLFVISERFSCIWIVKVLFINNTRYHFKFQSILFFGFHSISCHFKVFPLLSSPSYEFFSGIFMVTWKLSRDLLAKCEQKDRKKIWPVKINYWSQVKTPVVKRQSLISFSPYMYTILCTIFW